MQLDAELITERLKAALPDLKEALEKPLNHAKLLKIESVSALQEAMQGATNTAVVEMLEQLRPALKNKPDLEAEEFATGALVFLKAAADCRKVQNNKKSQRRTINAKDVKMAIESCPYIPFCER